MEVALQNVKASFTQTTLYTLIVALSTGWFHNRKRCHYNITILGNGRRVSAMVVDECDSRRGCDAEHDFQPPTLLMPLKLFGVPRSDLGSIFIYNYNNSLKLLYHQ
ncbi:hypothetical protein VNO78_25277 [Psophocarpus tetragonolobus]|uniref:Uncharacterized protein n=1 Tax=Psophocarpus tetragonolobus TaxID=3891 RepID=A0AAN9S5N4_PSOTE